MTDASSHLNPLTWSRLQHAGFGVQREHYDAVGECLIWTLNAGLKDAWTDDVADAWVWVYQMIAKTMGDAGEMALKGKGSPAEEMVPEPAEEKVPEPEEDAVEKVAPVAAPSPLPSLRALIRAGVARQDLPLRPSCAALLIIDIQKELARIDVDSPNLAYVKEAFPRMIENVTQLLGTVRGLRDDMKPGETGAEVIFTYCQALTDDSRDVSLDYKLSGPFLSRLPSPSRPAEFVGDVRPIPGRDVTLPKTSCSVFQSTNIDYVLRNLEVEQLVVCGQLTDQCVESCVRDAADRGYLVTVAEDACTALSEADHAKGLHGMMGFSRILSTDQVLQELGLN